MKTITTTEAAEADRKTGQAFRRINEEAAQKGHPLDPLTQFELHRALWRSHAGGDAVRVVPDRD